MNKLREMFKESSKVDEQIRKIKQQLRDDKHCMFCVHSHQESHYEMGYDAGEDTYCDFYKRLMLYLDDNGQQCLFWEERYD